MKTMSKKIERDNAFEQLHRMFGDNSKPDRSAERRSEPAAREIPVPEEHHEVNVRYRCKADNLETTIPEGMTAEDAIACMCAAVKYFADEVGLDEEKLHSVFFSALMQAVLKEAFSTVGEMIDELKNIL